MSFLEKFQKHKYLQLDTGFYLKGKRFNIERAAIP